MKNARLVVVAGKVVLRELDRLRAEFERTGDYPVLLGDPKDVEGVEENQDVFLGDDRDGTLALRSAATIDGGAWLRTMGSRGGEDPDEVDENFLGEWPEVTPDRMGFITHQDVLSGEIKEKLTIALVPVASPCEVFAKLAWGGWNDCPESAVHVAVHRYWGEKYGAEVVAITSDVVQCRVARPPADREACMELAREQYAYCYDIVEQGVQTIANLAATLQSSKYWYFWWD